MSPDMCETDFADAGVRVYAAIAKTEQEKLALDAANGAWDLEHAGNGYSVANMNNLLKYAAIFSSLPQYPAGFPSTRELPTVDKEKGGT